MDSCLKVSELARLCRAPLLVLAVVLLAMPAVSPAANGPQRSFDHSRSGFPLTGAHARADCADCHARGVFKGTPRDCNVCHLAGSGRASSSKPANHIQTTAPCGQCHKSTLTWAGARFDHGAVAPGTCATCHNGSKATGKHAGHVMTTASCDQCHRTVAWLPAGFNHSGIAPGTCATCHNGSRATGKPANHVQTTESCDRCHNTTTWLGARFNHTGVTPGTCATCHNGSRATGKPANHVQTTASCDQCHTTTTWLGAKFDHSAVTPGTCATCHGTGGTARTKVPVPHFSGSCDKCHTTTAFTPARSYTHISAYYKPHNSGVSCYDCHTTRTDTATWSSGSYKPDCAGCHATRFKADAHKKVDSPKVLYTVSELRNCAGSCHTYTDTTLTTILKTRSSKHRSTDGGW